MCVPFTTLPFTTLAPKGYWYALRIGQEVEVTTIYCPTYDVALNSAIREFPNEGA